ncbi:MAG: hypothetical protein WBB15_04465 [Ornithinimicrobium sp.]
MRGNNLAANAGCEPTSPRSTLGKVNNFALKPDVRQQDHAQRVMCGNKITLNG